VTEEQKGITGESTATSSQTDEQSSTTAPEQQVETPEKYRGKSPEELASILQEQEKLMGRQAKELGDLRKQVEQFQSMMAQFAPQIGIGQPPMGQMGFGIQPGVPDQFGQIPYYGGGVDGAELPPDEIPTVQDVDKLVEMKIQQREAERMAWEEQRRVMEASMYLNTGRENAIKRNPKLYEGIDQQVATTIYNSFLSGAITPLQLADPQTWEKTALMVRAAMGEYDLSKYVNQPSPPPASIPYTERPQTVKPSEEKSSATLTEEQKMFVRLAGFNPDEFAKELAEEKEGGM